MWEKPYIAQCCPHSYGAMTSLIYLPCFHYFLYNPTFNVIFVVTALIEYLGLTADLK